MHRRVIARPWRAHVRQASTVSPVLLAAASVALGMAVAAPAAPLAAQTTPRDSTAQADSTRRGAQRIEGVLVSAIRAGDATVAQKTIRRDVITQRHFGQDVPLLLQGASPSLTAHTETGTAWGYSYLRLRGLDQTRINITLDGVPLNDMEDQVLYFADLPDLMSSVQSVQVQRGVGTSTAGTASFAGSVNFETTPIALANGGSDVSLQLGSFGAQRVSAGFRSGLTASRFAVYGRASALRTNGYRDHSGVMGRSGFLGAGWFGDRTIVKATALVGLPEKDDDFPRQRGPDVIANMDLVEVDHFRPGLECGRGAIATDHSQRTGSRIDGGYPGGGFVGVHHHPAGHTRLHGDNG